MDEKLLEIHEFTGPGYQPVIDFSEWRVAILNYIDEINPERIEAMERHNETDEVFVMIKGRAILFLGEGEENIVSIQEQVLETGKLYNVKRKVWHSIVLSKDGSVLIVENRDTNRENSNYISLNSEQRSLVIKRTWQERLD
jgi:mannose-6-phosphate isomerase-like protein (cupin superfamily)